MSWIEELKKNREIEIDIPIGDNVLKVWLKRPNFVDVQRALRVLMLQNKQEGVTFDVPAYNEHILTEWVIRTEPEMERGDILNLPYEIGKGIVEKMMSPMEMIQLAQGDFTKPEGNGSETSSETPQ
jgi:hypothetical protein